MSRRFKLQKEARKEPPKPRTSAKAEDSSFDEPSAHASRLSIEGLEAIETHLPFVASHLHSMADLFAERNAVYKDNFRMVGRMMKAMFPEGIKLVTEQDHNKFHLFMLAIVKLSRYANNYEEGHMDSLDDAIVYLSMVAAMDDERGQAEDLSNGSTP